jgi:hypothetical protein
MLAMMNAMISHSKGGMGISKEKFKDLNTKCNITGPFK